MGQGRLAIGVVSLAAVASPVLAQSASQPLPAGSPAAWFDPDSYPSEALRANRQGRVVLLLDIDPAGNVANCTVRQSSGTTVLDDVSCALARTRGHFDPATDGAGKPVAGTYVMPVRWAIPETPPTPMDVTTTPLHQEYTVEGSFDAAGKMVSCRVTAQVPTKPGDGACRAGWQNAGGQPVVKDGKPVAFKVVQHMTSDVIVTP